MSWDNVMPRCTVAHMGVRVASGTPKWAPEGRAKEKYVGKGEHVCPEGIRGKETPFETIACYKILRSILGSAPIAMGKPYTQDSHANLAWLSTINPCAKMVPLCSGDHISTNDRNI